MESKVGVAVKTPFSDYCAGLVDWLKERGIPEDQLDIWKNGNEPIEYIAAKSKKFGLVRGENAVYLQIYAVPPDDNGCGYIEAVFSLTEIIKLLENYNIHMSVYEEDVGWTNVTV